jgi:hypothetical protein
MKIVKYKIIGSMIIAFLFIIVGAFNFARGDKDGAKSFFILGLISTAASLIWFFTYNRNQKNSTKISDKTPDKLV